MDDFAFGKRFKETVGNCDVLLLRNEVVPQPRIGDADLSGGEEELAPDEVRAGEGGDEAISRFRDLES